jgi:hypothetical protein
VGPSELKPAFTHEFSVTAVILRGANWTEEQVLAQLKRTAEIYVQCGMRMRQATLVTVDPPKPEFIDIDFQYTGRDKIMAAMMPLNTDRPAVFFLRSIDTGEAAYATPPGFTFPFPVPDSSRGTAVVSAKVLSKAYYDYYIHHTQNPTAHELAHILGTRGHNDDDQMNLLHFDGKKRNGALLPEQCAAFQRSKYVNRLN